MCVCLCVCVCITVKGGSFYPFSATSGANNAALCSAFDEPQHWWDCETKKIATAVNSDALSVQQYPSDPQRGALLCSCCAPSQSRLRWALFWHLPSVLPLFTLLNVCACVRACVCVCVCVCLIKLCLATPQCCGCLWIHSNPSITDTTSFTFLMPCLRNVSGGRIYFQGVPLIGLP